MASMSTERATGARTGEQFLDGLRAGGREICTVGWAPGCDAGSGAAAQALTSAASISDVIRIASSAAGSR